MKKILLALMSLMAFCILAPSAFAQDSVRIYGSADGGLRYLTNVDAAGNSKLSMSSNGTYKSSRLGFEGSEDLGGGLNAHFNLESRYQVSTGVQVGVLFNAASYVGLGSSSWGSVDMGRQFTLAFKTIAAYDPFAMKYTGIVSAIQATLGVTENNEIQYNGTFGPVTARLVYATGEQAGTLKNGSTQGMALAYANGPISAGGDFIQKRTVDGLLTNHYTAGGAYVFDRFRATVGYANQKDQAAIGPDTSTKYLWTGLQYDFQSPFSIIGAYYRTSKTQATDPVGGKRDIYILSVTYALSKRTNLYAEVDRTKLNGNFVTVGQGSQTGMAFGLNQLF
jgi:predicted porin